MRRAVGGVEIGQDELVRRGRERWSAVHDSSTLPNRTHLLPEQTRRAPASMRGDFAATG